MKKIPLFVTLDAEGDNGWGRPRNITTENAKGVERFQKFCEEYNVKPIYLTSYEMASDSVFVNALKQKNKDGLCEVGMHMHGWSTPPDYDLTGDDLENLPFITEYPTEIIKEKVKNMTKLLIDNFGMDVVSHRSGRWIVNKEYLNVLVENGYKVDCSVTPLYDWSCSMGDPKQNGGADYSKCPAHPYEISLQSGRILELPMTTMNNPLYNNPLVNFGLLFFPKSTRIYNGINSRQTVMLRPNLRNKAFLMSMIEKLGKMKDIQHIEFMIHTSEVYKGTCPHCNTDEDLNELYELMGAMFTELNKFCVSKTFREYIK